MKVNGLLKFEIGGFSIQKTIKFKNKITVDGIKLKWTLSAAINDVDNRY